MSHQSPSKVLLAVSVALFALLIPGTSAAQEPGPYPGLPEIPGDPNIPGSEVRSVYGWLGTTQVGLAGSVRAKQWARLPLGVLAANASFLESRYGETQGDGDLFIEGGVDVEAFFVSPDGSAEPYGFSPEIGVRTVAFGSIPVEVRLQVRQRREGGLPVGFHLQPIDRIYFIGANGIGGLRTVAESVRVQDLVEVTVTGLALDGVDVPVGSTCSTGPTAALDAASETWETTAPDQVLAFDPAVGFVALNGGTLNGTLDVPPFSGCAGPSGDDLSDILTSAISGPGNPVTLRVGHVSCIAAVDPEFGAPVPPPPGADTPAEAACSDALPYPLNPLITTVPTPLPFPTQPPGSQGP